MSGNHLRFGKLTTVIICYRRIHCMRMQSVSGVVYGMVPVLRCGGWAKFSSIYVAQQHEIEKFIFPQGLWLNFIYSPNS